MNNLTAGSPIYWSKGIQKSIYKRIIIDKVTDFSVESEVGENGIALNKPYRSSLIAEEYSKGVSLEPQDISYNDDYLYIDQFYSLLMYVDDVDKIQNKYDTVYLWLDEAGKRLNEKAEAYTMFVGAQGAYTKLDAGDFGGTTGQSLVLSTSNLVNVYGKINEVLDENNIEPDQRFIIINPAFKNVLWQLVSGKETLLGDTVSKNGVVSTYGSLEHYLSTNLPSKLVLTLGTNPSNNDTIVINGVTITFKSTLDSTPACVKIGSTVDNTINNLVGFVNSKGVGVAGVSTPASTNDKRVIQNWSAEGNTTTDEVTFYIKGSSKPVYSSSNSSNPFNTNKSGVLLIAGRKGAISTAFQLGKMNGIVDVEKASTVSNGKRGYNYMPLSIFGAKVFNNSKFELVTLLVK